MNWIRVPTPKMLKDHAPDMQVWQRDVEDGHLSVFAGTEPNGFHLSISHRTNDRPPKPGRYPTWDEIHEARYRFCPPKATMGILLPPKEEYVDMHPTTFHLWQVD